MGNSRCLITFRSSSFGETRTSAQCQRPMRADQCPMRSARRDRMERGLIRRGDVHGRPVMLPVWPVRIGLSYVAVRVLNQKENAHSAHPRPRPVTTCQRLYSNNTHRNRTSKFHPRVLTPHKPPRQQSLRAPINRDWKCMQTPLSRPDAENTGPSSLVSLLTREGAS